MGYRTQKKKKIAITIDPFVLSEVECTARSLGLNRSQCMEMFLKHGIMSFNWILKGGIDHGKITIS